MNASVARLLATFDRIAAHERAMKRAARKPRNPEAYTVEYVHTAVDSSDASVRVPAATLDDARRAAKSTAGRAAERVVIWRGPAEVELIEVWSGGVRQ